MNGYCLWTELPAVNLSSDHDVKLEEKQFQHRQHYIQNVESPRYILDDPVWVQDPTSKEWLSTTITGLTSKSDAYVVTLNQSNKCYECNVKYLRPRNGLVSNMETTAVILAWNPEPSHVVEHFLHSDVFLQVEATVVSMLITKNSSSLENCSCCSRSARGESSPTQIWDAYPWWC